MRPDTDVPLDWVMSLTHADPPDDPEALRAWALALRAELLVRDGRIAALEGELKTDKLVIEKLEAELATLKRARFGRSSEKLDRRIEQLELLIGDLQEGSAENTARSDALQSQPMRAARKVRGPRRPLPDHLPREIIRHEPPACCPGCGGARLTVLGEDRREVLEYVPAHFKVIVHVRPKVSCRACERITQPPMPSVPLERALPGPALLAHVAVSKFSDHLPLHRQSEIYARSGLELDRALLAEWMGRLTYLLDPLVRAIGDHVRAGSALHADDTSVPVLDPGRGKTKTGRLWTLVRDERPWSGPAPPAAVYLYSPDRRGVQAEALLKDCRGFLHVDAYAGFARLYAPTTPQGDARLAEVACWAHARRKIYDVHHSTRSPAAAQALERIAELFAIEAEIGGAAPATRLEARRRHTIPRLAALKDHLEATLARISRKSKLAEAIRYATSRWEALSRFTNDGRLEMTNNAAERAIRPLALGRKNWSFVGSDAGGDRAAAFYTLTTTARLNGIDPEAWLTDVINRIADHPASQLDDLLPWNWQAAHQQKAA